uniref:Uncharacterized protein n=1 Tax=Amphora coffeiformis TaxID=265554 RepID=A0A7S3KVK8_9STRA|mmetsp:Transcript_10653/g.20340  ORF Transcript_10653/g.20340 Transcript_10653/m.20340 type:complete len:744 (+) Transcript_10653:219-2450(+)
MMRFSLLFLCCSFLQHKVVNSQGTSLAGGQIVTRTDVQRFADLAQDLAQMQTYVENGSSERVLTLFQQGMHAASAETGQLFALKDLGETLAGANPKTPAFLYHLYGLTDRSVNFAFELEAESDYINKFVEEIIEENVNFAVDAMISVSIWMYATHLIYDGVYRCHQRTVADNPNVVDINGGGFDEFIALYIGEGQNLGSANGDSLYTWAQQMGGFFGTNDPESPVNTEIVLLYGEAKSALSETGACSKDVPGTAAELWKIATQMVSQMSIPLFQGLLYSILEENTDGVKVYAKALVPQIAKCRPSTYKRLKRNLLDDGVSLDDVTVSEVLEDLQDAYACFGYTCRAIGNYNDDSRLECDEDKENPALAGYDPLTDVSAVARVDLDALQIRILASLQANVFAEFLYMYGTNVFKFGSRSTNVKYVSMHDIAVSSERSNSPSFAFYEDYFDERDYADKIIRNALTGKSKWLATEQVAVTASLACAYMITFMEAIAKLRIGVADCKEADGEGLAYTLDPVDEAAALIVGSMGGNQFGGATDREDGQLMYSLANEVAFQFGTLNSDEYAQVNKEIIDLLLAARAEIDALDCTNLEISVDLLERLLMVGIIQAAIKAAIQNESLSAISTATSIAEGELLSLAVLPYFKKFRPDTASIVEENMIWQSNRKPVQAGSSNVARAFGTGITYAVDLRCSYLGSTQGVDPCKGVPASAGSAGFATKPRSAGVASRVSIFATFIALAVGSATYM